MGRGSCWGEDLVGVRILLGRGPCWGEDLVVVKTLLWWNGVGMAILHSSLFTFPHLCIKTSRTLMSLGDTPGMRLACARVSGFMAVSFCLPSVEISLMSL